MNLKKTKVARVCCAPDSSSCPESANSTQSVMTNLSSVEQSRPIAIGRLLKISEVEEITGMCRSSIYNRRREGDFVEPVQVGPRSVRYVETEIRGWMASRVRKQYAKGGRHEVR